MHLPAQLTRHGIGWMLYILLLWVSCCGTSYCFFFFTLNFHLSLTINCLWNYCPIRLSCKDTVTCTKLHKLLQEYGLLQSYASRVVHVIWQVTYSQHFWRQLFAVVDVSIHRYELFNGRLCKREKGGGEVGGEGEADQIMILNEVKEI